MGLKVRKEDQRENKLGEGSEEDLSLDVSKLQQVDALQQKADFELSDELVSELTPMVEGLSGQLMSGRKMPPGVTLDDLVSWGLEGLLKAHRSYKPNKGSQFKTYAYYRIRGEILDRIREEWQYRNPGDYQEYRKRLRERIADVAEEALKDSKATEATLQNEVSSLIENVGSMYMISLDNIEIESNRMGTMNPESEVIQDNPVSNRLSLMWEEMKNLDDTEKKLLDLFYIQGYKQKEIADKLKFSKSKVCRMHLKILDKLRRRMGNRMADEGIL